MYFIVSDHAGFNLKNEIINYFKLNNLQIEDLLKIEKSEIKNGLKLDYPDIAKLLCEKLIENMKVNINSIGILICGSGIGVSIAANRYKKIRAALCTDSYTASMSRYHNNANVLCLGERVIGIGNAIDIVKTFINSKFEFGRHQIRVDKLYDLGD